MSVTNKANEIELEIVTDRQSYVFDGAIDRYLSIQNNSKFYKEFNEFGEIFGRFVMQIYTNL